MPTIIEMRRTRANLWEQMKAIHEGAATENRALSAEERERWDRLNADLDALKATIDREERLAELGAEMAAREAPAAGGNDGATGVAGEYRSAFWRWARDGMDELEPEERKLLRKRAVAAPAEARALATGIGGAGGFTIADEDMAPIQDAMLAFGGIRQSRAQKITTSTGADYPIPTNDDTGNVGARVAENTAITELDVTVGQKILHAHLYTSRMIRVPYTFLQDTSINDFESWLIGKIGERIGRITNTEFTTGTGNVMPEGLVTASILGATAAANNAITFGELVTLEHSVGSVYRKQAEWMFADSTLLFLKTLVDGMGRPLFVPGIATREPDTILGYPYIINDDVPAIGAAARSVVFGDLFNFKVRDVRGITVLRLVERYADFLQVAFLAFSRHDSGMVDAGQHPIRHLVHP